MRKIRKSTADIVLVKAATYSGTSDACFESKPPMTKKAKLIYSYCTTLNALTAKPFVYPSIQSSKWSRTLGRLIYEIGGRCGPLIIVVRDRIKMPDEQVGGGG